MEITFTQQENAFRQEVRKFARQEVTDELLHQTGGLTETHDETFYRKLAEAGYIGLQWPKEYGGQGRSHMEFVIFLEEIQ